MVALVSRLSLLGAVRLGTDPRSDQPLLLHGWRFPRFTFVIDSVAPAADISGYSDAGIQRGRTA